MSAGVAGGSREQEERVRKLIELVVETERLRNQIPYSIESGLMERTLKDLAYESDLLVRPSRGFPLGAPAVRGLYSDVRHEAVLLSRLALALRLRMEAIGRAEVSGVDYFRRRLDLFLERIRGLLGFNPRIPLYMQVGGWRARRI